MPTAERLKAEILDALISRVVTDGGSLGVEKIMLPESGRDGYRLTIDSSIVIDKQHLEVL